MVAAESKQERLYTLCALVGVVSYVEATSAVSGCEFSPLDNGSYATASSQILGF